MRLRVDQKRLREAHRRRIVQTALEKSPVPSIAESPECGTEKVWLCCEEENKFHVASGPNTPAASAIDGWRVTYGEWIDTNITAKIARLIHPSHNLQPGECCEVPARERSIESLAFCIDRIQFHDDSTLVRRDGNLWSVYGPGDEPLGTMPTLGSAIDTLEEFGCGPEGEDAAVSLGEAKTDGPRWTEQAVAGEAFLLRYGCTDMYLATDGDGKLATRRVWSDRPDAPWSFGENIDPGVGPDGPAHLAARERARELGLVEQGPRWKDILLGFEPYKFIARIDAYDGYLVTCSRGLAIGFIAETGWSGFGWVYLDSAQKYFSETTGTHAELHKRLYDKALSANQLPPHPRWAKPEGAEVFLGWSPDSESPADFWWDCLGQIVCIDAKGIVYPYTVRGIDESPNQRSGFALALARARELRLPERAAAQKRVTAAEAELAAAKAALAEIGGGA